MAQLGAPRELEREKDRLLRKLMHDNEVLMEEVANLDAKMRQLQEEAELLRGTNHSLQRERAAVDEAAQSQAKLLVAMEESLEQARAQHGSERELLSGIFHELEAQLALARSEREELQLRSESERCEASRRQRELEEDLSRVTQERDRMQSMMEAERISLSRELEQKLAAVRLQHEDAREDKGFLRRLERDMAELKEISASMQRESHPWAAPESFLPYDGHGTASHHRPFSEREINTLEAILRFHKEQMINSK
eukprot:scaffold267341_cov30-Tisochrysis_lutea.AAC.3